MQKRAKAQPFHLRIPTDLKAELRAEADAKPGTVSLNTYIVALLTTHPDRSKRRKP